MYTIKLKKKNNTISVKHITKNIRIKSTGIRGPQGEQGEQGPPGATGAPGGVNSVAGRTGDVVLTKTDVGLSNVDNTSDANKPVSTAMQTALNNKLAKVYLTVGVTGSGADYECDGTSDNVQFQQAVDYCVANNVTRFVVLPGHYYFSAIVKITNPDLSIEGSEFGEVIITPSSTLGVSKTVITADALFTVYDDTASDKVLSNIKFKNIVFDFNDYVSPSSTLRTPSAIRYWPYKGSNTLDRETTENITENTVVASLDAGKDILYGWLENTTTNSTSVALSTVLPEVTSGLEYTAATAFGNIPNTQLPSGSYLSPPASVSVNNTYLGVLPQNFALTSIAFTNNGASTVTFKLQVKLSSVLTDDPGDYTDITNEITIAAGSTTTVLEADLINGVFPSSSEYLIRVNEASSTWSNVKLGIGAKILTPVLTSISVSGTSIGILPKDYDITNVVLTNNTASPTNIKLQARRYLAPAGRNNTYHLAQHWLTLTDELTIPASGVLTIKRSDFIKSLPGNDATELRAVQGNSAWSGVDFSLTSVERMRTALDFYREILVPGEQTISSTGAVSDVSLGIFPRDYYVKSITFTETSGNDWNGYMTDDDVGVVDRVFVPANSSVTVSTYGNGGRATAVVSGGSITGGTVTATGSNYISAPIVQVQGDGTGATATATVNANGNITAINITNGGSGYTQASLNILSIQRYNFINPLSANQNIKLRAQQPNTTQTGYPYAKTWNDASIDVSVTLGVKIGITKEYMNDIFPQDTSKNVYLVNMDNDFNGASLKTTIQKGSVSHDFDLENIKIIGWQATGFGSIALQVGKVLGTGNLSIGQHDGMKFKNLIFEDDYYPDPQNATVHTIGLHFQGEMLRNLSLEDITFSNTHGKSIYWTGDSGDSVPVIALRARKNIRVKNLKCRRTKRGVYGVGSATRLGDWYDETRIGFKNLTFDDPEFYESTSSWQSDQSYKIDGATDPMSITTVSPHTRSCIMFMNSDNVVINNPRFIGVRTCFDIGYTNPPGYESKHIQINNIYSEDCWELGDLDGNYGTQYNGGQIVRLRNTGKINNYGIMNPTIWDGVYFEDVGLQTLTSIVNKCVFLLTGTGHQFRDCVFNMTQPHQLDYIFQEQDGQASASIPVIYEGNTFMGVPPAVRTFGLNSEQYHRIISNKGVTEEEIQAVFNNVRDPITPTAYLGVGYGNITTSGVVIDSIEDTDKVDLTTNQTIAGQKTFTSTAFFKNPGAQVSTVIDADTNQEARLLFRKNSADDWSLRSTGGSNLTLYNMGTASDALVIDKATNRFEPQVNLSLRRIANPTGSANGYYLFADSSGNPKLKLSNSTVAGKFLTFITTGVTTDRSLTVPDKTGTIAVTSDLVASSITNTPAGTIASTTVQDAINELATDLDAKAPLASPALTGTPTAPTASTTTNTTQVATTAFVQGEITANATPDASTSVKGKVQLTGDLGGTAVSPETKARTSVAVVGATTGDFPVSSYANFRAALLAALTAAQAVSGEVFIKAGTYDLTSQLVFHNLGNITVRGAGMGKTIIRRTYSGATSMIDFGDSNGPSSYNNVTVSDLTIDQNETGSGFGLAMPWCTNVVVERCAFINQNTTSLAALLVGKFAGASDGFEANNIRIVNCLFDYSNAASLSWEVVTVTGGRDVSFEGCRWFGIASNWPGLSIYNTEQFRFINNFVVDAQITYGGRGTYIVTGNQFEQSYLFVNQAKNTIISSNTWYSFGDTTNLPNGIEFKGGYKTGTDAETPWYINEITFATTAVNTGSDVITLGSDFLNDIATGDPVRITSTGTVPGGLTSGTEYYIIKDSSTEARVALSESDALAGTDIDITSQGSGTHTITASTVFSCENVIVDGNIFKGCKDNAIYAKTTTESGREVLDCRDLQITNNLFDGCTQIPIVAYATNLRIEGNNLLNCNTTDVAGNDTFFYVAAEVAQINNNFGSSTNIDAQGIIIDVERHIGLFPNGMKVYARGNNLNVPTLARHYNSGGSLNAGATTNVFWQPLILEGANGDLLTINALASNNGIIRFKSNGTERGAVFNPTSTNDLTVRAQGNVQIVADHLNSDDTLEWSANGLDLNSHKITEVTDPTSAQDAATKAYVDTGASLYRPSGTDVAVTDGGTGASNASDARTNLGLGSIATLSTITLTSNVTGTLPVGNGGTGATTLTGILLGNGTSAFTTVTAPSGTIVGTTDTQTLTNKRVTTRVGTTTSSATPTINTDNVDQYNITALATSITSMTTNLSGTPTDGQKLLIRIKDNGTARAITWGASFVSSGVAALPTTTIINKTHMVGLIYDSAAALWVCMASDTTGY